MEKEYYAVNVADMSTDMIISQFLIAPVIQERQTVNIEKKRIDGYGVIMNGEPERLKAIIEIVRQKYHKNKFRFYVSKNMKTWKRI